MSVQIKPMETEDEIRGKAFVHWKSWQESYPGIVDAGYLSRLTLETCEEIAFRFPENTLVAKDGGRVIGFAGAGAYRREDGADTGEGEVYAIYVLEQYQKRGVGYALMRRALELLAGCRVAYVWVLAENAKAVSFYERVGFRADGAEKELVLGAPVRVKRMAMMI
ncbi:MAG: GNAT family N-acetyltransferase [Oscillospiraceae bacterium]|nr:GNAT family N-acetyltransferase [Oscillospiraceae bacterium]